MAPAGHELKNRYRFSDFLFYTDLLAVPMVVAVIGILAQSVWWTVVYAILAVGVTTLILKFFCTRCPHYTREGRILKCIFFWGLPKFFQGRPGNLNFVDKAVAVGAPAVLVIFPLYWLFVTPGLLIAYVLSLAGFGAAVYRNECHRCIFDNCPMNKAPEAIGSPPHGTDAGGTHEPK